MESLASVASFLYTAEVSTDFRKRKTWHSPLTKARKETRDVDRVVRRKLYGPEETAQVSLSSIYGINLDTPFPTVAEHTFFALRDLLFLIENWAEKNSADRDSIRKHIQLHLNSHLPFEAKLKEIGMLYFYLDRDERIPKELGTFESCFLLRREEIKNELNEINKAHKKLSTSLREVFPSGRVNYLFRAFVRMILSTEGKYNSGGVLACLELLQDAEICINLSSEHIYQLRNVLSRLYGNSSAKETLEKSIKPAPEMEDFIRLELKISLRAPLDNAPYVQWASLFALFFDLRQYKESNCFAICTLAFLIHHYPLIVLERLFIHFAKGELTVEEKSLSIPSLLEPYLIYEKDLVDKHDPIHLLEHPLFQTLMETSEGKPVNLPKKISLRNTFCKINEGDTRKWMFQEELFGVLKFDILQRLLLSEMELICFNFDIQDNSNLISKKNIILKEVTNKLTEKMKSDSRFSHIINSQEVDLFFDLWKKAIFDKFLIDPRAERNIAVQKEGAKTFLVLGSIETRKKIECIDDIDRYTGFVSGSARLNKVENQKLLWITDFEEVKKTLLQEVDQCAEMIDSKKIDDLSKEFKLIIETEETSEILAEILCMNAKLNLKPEDLLKLKIPIYPRLGGSMTTVLKQIYNKKVKFYDLKKSTSLVDFLEKLCRACFSIHYDKSDIDLTSPNSLFIVSTQTHSFTMLPFLLENLWNRDKELSKALEDKLMKNGKRHSESILSKQKIEQILSKVCITEKRKEKFSNFFLKKPYKPLEFFNKLKSKFPQAEHPNLIHEINNGILSFSVNDFRTEEVLAEANIRFTNEKLEKFQNEFKTAVGTSLKTPREFTVIIQKLLVSYHNYPIDPIKLENSICHVHELPEIAYIGDLNYVDSYIEAPSHDLLLIKWEFVSSSLEFFRRHGDEDIITERNSYLNSFKLYYSN